MAGRLLICHACQQWSGGYTAWGGFSQIVYLTTDFFLALAQDCLGSIACPLLNGGSGVEFHEYALYYKDTVQDFSDPDFKYSTTSVSEMKETVGNWRKLLLLKERSPSQGQFCRFLILLMRIQLCIPRKAGHSVVSTVCVVSLLFSSLSHRTLNFDNVTAARTASLLSNTDANRVLMDCDRKIG